MRRRRFLSRGVLAGVAAAAGVTIEADAAADSPTAAAAGPVVASTWSFGVAANREAWRRLTDGASALDAVESGARVVESDPDVETVGYGGLPNLRGEVELDAAVMDGESLAAGAVAGLRDIAHPVSVARAVMESTSHVLLVGDGARRFALSQGFKKKRLLTDKARRVWKSRVRSGGARDAGDHDTLGIVALDGRGGLAAATTTSGLALKLPGRVGDSPLIGHGLYCDANAGAAVATGIGEEIIRVCGCYQIVEFMRQGLGAGEAVERLLRRMPRRRAGRDVAAAFVAVRADGDVGWGSLSPWFEAAVTRDGSHDLIRVEPLEAGG